MICFTILLNTPSIILLEAYECLRSDSKLIMAKATSKDLSKTR